MIEIDDNGIVWCYPDGATKKQCDPLGLYRTAAECGNCPILDMCYRFENMLYGDTHSDVKTLHDEEKKAIDYYHKKAKERKAATDPDHHP